jgi:uncharacterized protein (DUF608 family)
MRRRDFIKNFGLAGASIFFPPRQINVGILKQENFLSSQNLANKKLDPAWVRSLRERDAPTIYRKSKNELQYIGMPVGGIFTGTLYLGGDGRLWLWDIFNRNQCGINPKIIDWEGKKLRPNDGSSYVQPPYGICPIQQGFAVGIEDGVNLIVKAFRQDYWDEIEFRATYPIAKISYQAKDLPMKFILEAYSPFIPMDEENSGLPVSIMSFKVINLMPKKVRVSLTGWLENGVLLDQGESTEGLFCRENKAFSHKHVSGIQLGAETNKEEIRNLPSFGSTCLAVLRGSSKISEDEPNEKIISWLMESIISPRPAKPMAILSSSREIGEGKEWQNHFLISWHFPNLSLPDIPDKGQYYSNRFRDAVEVASYVSDNFDYLSETTRQWYEAWYNSSLPWWFLERIFANVSTLATTTCHRLKSGRFYGWEGVGCCEGTCTHVWSYAQAVARLFPSLEKDTRARVDLGISFDPETGMIHYRGPGTGEATDGQAGTVLRIYREHQMSKDSSFLREHWGKIKKAVEFILNHDTNKDGLIDGRQPNTLDADWYGDIPWISSLCLAAVKAGERMALEMGDTAFASRCREFFEIGKKSFEERLFNGEYFIQMPDPKKGRTVMGAYNTCHIDQVLGQSWAFQVGLGRIISKEKVLSALCALWKYNFFVDVGPYIERHKGGRPYCLPGEGGMVMNTNPIGEENPYGENITGPVGYFMNV